MLYPILVFVIVYLFIATEWVDKTIAAVVGGGLVVGLHLIGYEEALRAIDLNVLFLLIGMMVVVNTLSETGVFEWLAIRLARLARGNGLIVAVLFMVLTAILSAFLDNVTTVILMAPITILLAQLLEIPVVPLLIMEAIFSNIGGTATLVGDPPNILIGSQAHLSFNDFIFNLSPPVLVSMVVLLGLMGLMFGRQMSTRPETRLRIARSRPEKAIIQPDVLIKSLVVFALILAGFFCGRLLDIEPGIIALVGGLVMVAVCKKSLHRALAGVEWDTILFFAGLFMMVAALEAHGVFTALGEFILSACKGNLMLTAFAVLWVSALASTIVNNIPLVMAMIPLVQGIVPEFAGQMGLVDPAAIQSQIAAPLLWSLALGACFGGNGTLVGASANVVIAQMANRNNCPITFMGFTKYGFPFMLISLVVASAYIYLRYFLK
jgi:Na+/H+ antiporter NhaD/arsenite permease-like protein